MRLQRGAPFDDDDASAKLPEPLRVLDLPQERLMRSLGDGHRVIHGVAGSGKTLLLTYRAEYLAKAHTPDPKPILILCYNEPLAVTLAGQMQAKGLCSRVQARHFHKWCRDQLVAFGQELPAPNMPVGAKMDELVQRVIRAVATIDGEMSTPTPSPSTAFCVGLNVHPPATWFQLLFVVPSNMSV